MIKMSVSRDSENPFSDVEGDYDLSKFKNPVKYGIFAEIDEVETMIGNLIEESGLVESHLRRKAKELRENGCENVVCENGQLSFVENGQNYTIKTY